MARRGGNEDNTVYVGNLSRGFEEKVLEDEFGKFGKLVKVWVARKPHGFAYIEFEDRRDAEDAVEGLNGKQVEGDFLRVELKGRGGRGPPKRSDYRVSIQNMSSTASWQDLKSFLKKVAEPGYVDIIKGEGVAEFDTEDEMRRVIDKLDDTEFFGQRLRIEQDTSGRDIPGPPRRERPPPRDSYRDRDRDYGRGDRERDYGYGRGGGGGDRDYGRRYSPERRRRSRSRSRSRDRGGYDDRRRYDDRDRY